MAKKAIIIYDTRFSNTEKVAKALAEGMKEHEIEVDSAKVDNININKLAEYDLFAIGGPTHALGISKPMKEFLRKLENSGLKGKKAFAFDTRLKSRFAGSAAKGIEKRLKELGMDIVKPHVSATVEGTEGPLEKGMEEMFKQIGIELSNLMQ